MNHFPKDLLTVENLSLSQITQILDRAEVFSKTKPKSLESAASERKSWATFFTEPSTRSKISFQMAIQQLGMNHIDFLPEHSSMKKQESLEDTFLTLENLGIHGIITRTEFHQPLLDVAPKTKLRIINGGSGTEAHPSQALLDAFTVQQHFKKLSGLTIAFIGDVGKSRVARSGRKMFEMFGSRVVCAGPDEWISNDWQTAHARTEEVFTTADVVILLRAQLERETKMKLSPEDYLKHFGVTAAKFSQMKPQAIVMHPGPCNRGIEIADDVIHHPRCLMLKQVENGVKVRKALLEFFTK